MFLYSIFLTRSIVYPSLFVVRPLHCWKLLFSCTLYIGNQQDKPVHMEKNQSNFFLLLEGSHWSMFFPSPKRHILFCPMANTETAGNSNSISKAIGIPLNIEVQHGNHQNCVEPKILMTTRGFCCICWLFSIFIFLCKLRGHQTLAEISTLLLIRDHLSLLSVHRLPYTDVPISLLVDSINALAYICKVLELQEELCMTLNIQVG